MFSPEAVRKAVTFRGKEVSTLGGIGKCAPAISDRSALTYVATMLSSEYEIATCRRLRKEKC